MKFKSGQIIRFTYKHQAVDNATGDKFKEVLVLHPFWNNKLHGVDLKRLSPAERKVLEIVMDPEQNKKPSRVPLINNIMKRMDPSVLVNNPVAFYSQFVKPFLNRKEAYRTYIPHNMTGVTVQKNVQISGAPKQPEKPLFGKKPGEVEPQKPAEPSTTGMTPIDIMQQAARKKGLK